MPEMWAVVWHRRGDVRAQSWTLPDGPAPGWLRLRVTWCGLCGSDTAEYARGPVVIPVTAHPVSGRHAPLVLGHEVSGVVIAGTDAFPAGTRVVTDTLLGCDACPACRAGQVNLCPRLTAIGQQLDGGLAEFVDVPASTCLRVPDDLPMDVATLAEPLAVGIRAVARAGDLTGARAVVLGTGPVGLVIAMLLRKAEGPVVAVDPVAARREQVAALTGLATAADLSDVDSDDRAWVVFECAGSRSALAEAIAHMPARSRMVVVGIHDRATPIDMWATVHKELELVGSLSHDRGDFAAALEHLTADAAAYAGLITHRTDLPGAVHALALAGHDAPAGKVLAGPKGTPWTT
ncbi:alcohol dehydrogenase catalytic domain-containing protein [Asanoa sp. NPDC050611]|uniref:alcohol dehydrogenase catalytic domain-containing protein n=1 Tax=Asanoa sp. NPDC050611 TaxID=3157098 RepID=UPI0033F2AE96